jgi:septum formation topological specificity factor MinE
MQILANTAKHVGAVADFLERMRNEILKSLSRFRKGVARVEVQFSDQAHDRAKRVRGFRRQRVVWCRHSGE